MTSTGDDDGRRDTDESGDPLYCAALEAYARLGYVGNDPQTARFLRSLQRPDGSYANPFVARAAIGGLLLLGDVPRHDPALWLLGRLRFAGEDDAPPEMVSRMEGLLVAAESCPLLGTPLPPEICGMIVRYLRSSRRERGSGFRVPEPARGHPCVHRIGHGWDTGLPPPAGSPRLSGCLSPVHPGM